VKFDAGYGMQDEGSLRSRCWMLDESSLRSGMQDTGCRIQDAGYRIQDTGCRMQDTGCRIQDTGYRIQENVPVVINLKIVNHKS
jgi:hypothetical protein